MKQIDNYILEKLQINKDKKFIPEVWALAKEMYNKIVELLDAHYKGKYKYTIEHTGGNDIHWRGFKISFKGKVPSFHKKYFEAQANKISKSLNDPKKTNLFINVSVFDYISGTQFAVSIDDESDITEKLHIDNKYKAYEYSPNNKEELKEAIINVIEKAKNKSEIIDLNCIDVSKITDMSGVFLKIRQNHPRLIFRRLDLSTWDVSKVTNMTNMFNNCNLLTYININNWDVSKVQNTEGMFNGCNNLTYCEGIEELKFKSIEKMAAMFAGCSKIDFDANKWKLDYSKIHTWAMFRNCPNMKNIPEGIRA